MMMSPGSITKTASSQPKYATNTFVDRDRYPLIAKYVKFAGLSSSNQRGHLEFIETDVAVLATMNTKGKEARFVADVLARAGATPWIVDLSLKSHDADDADLAAADVAAAAGASWQTLNERSRQEAAAVMIEGGAKMLLDKFVKGEVSGAIGLGGANGTNLVCSILRALPYLVPKVMISTVAGTAAVQWYVAESDIAMYPSIGDVSLNRITKSVMENAAMAVAAAVKNRAAKQKTRTKKRRWSRSRRSAARPLVSNA